MRLGAAHGAFAAGTIDDLEPLCDTLDVYGLSAIPAPDLLGRVSWGWSLARASTSPT